MAYELKLPDLGEGLTEGEIGRWFVAEGQEVAEDDPLVEIQTDKTTVEIPSPAAGTVARILVPEGEVVPVGTVLVVIGEVEAAPVEAAAAPPSSAPGAPTGAVKATPLVRRLARELGVDLASIPPGPGGRVTEADVRSAATSLGQPQGQGPEGQGQGPEGRREPIRGVRRVIVEHLTRAHREIPSVTYVEECDFTDVALDLLVPLVLGATARTLKEFPELNARLE